ncbi:hypothetical protein HDU76_005126 [Blyttiomyces sp. JEL0837]|nr:hypothetical protein HDU76_005126 [Blyttiomyces sp. JEL0837]
MQKEIEVIIIDDSDDEVEIISATTNTNTVNPAQKQHHHHHQQDQPPDPTTSLTASHVSTSLPTSQPPIEQILKDDNDNASLLSQKFSASDAVERFMRLRGLPVKKRPRDPNDDLEAQHQPGLPSSRNNLSFGLPLTLHLGKLLNVPSTSISSTPPDFASKTHQVPEYTNSRTPTPTISSPQHLVPTNLSVSVPSFTTKTEGDVSNVNGSPPPPATRHTYISGPRVTSMPELVKMLEERESVDLIERDLGCLEANIFEMGMDVVDVDLIIDERTCVV